MPDARCGLAPDRSVDRSGHHRALRPLILGTLRLHEAPDPAALLRAAEELGVRAIDTADVYGSGPPHETEALIETSLPVQTKGGLLRTGARWLTNGTAMHLRAAAERSAAHHPVQVYFLHAIDPGARLARSWRALQRLRQDGVVGALGLCNPRYAELEEVLALGDLEVVQLPLSPFDRRALLDGTVRRCLDAGVAVQAHSPLGGWRRKKRAERSLRRIARRHGVSPERLSLRWLLALGVEPVVGCRRVETLTDAMGGVPPEAVDEALAAIPESRLAWEAPVPPEGDGEVVLVMGLPAAGKSTLARGFVEEGYVRLNRDTLGGTLSGIIKRLGEGLEEGERRFVLDNTWSERHHRAQVRELAAEHGCRMTVHWVDTPPERCMVQAVCRILADGNGLPGPEGLERKGGPVHHFGPRAIHKMRGRFEAPSAEEGFGLHVHAAPDLAWGSGEAVFVDVEGLEASDFGEKPFVIAWIPDAERAARLEEALEGTTPIAVLTCRHPPGPPRCWCRPPLPGLLVQALIEHGLDPRRCTLRASKRLRSMAEALSMDFEAV